MGFKNIEKKNWFYNLLHLYACFAHNKLFYRKIYVLHAEKIPENAHLIFTPNHQNALMDALAPLCNINRQLVFLARSDIFKKKFVASILYFLKILPIFRIRDGYGAVKKNKSTFQKTIDVIQAKNGLVILPEGNHQGIHQLRQLKKGFARIAFQTEEASEFRLDIKIIPFGIHYSDYVKSRSDLYINFGDPLSVSDYYELYKESPPKAINKITGDLAERIKPLMVNIDSTQHYSFYDRFRLFYLENKYNQQAGKKQERIRIEQEAVALLNGLEKKNKAQFTHLEQLEADYQNLLDKHGLQHRAVSKAANFVTLLMQSLGLAIGFPLFVYGLLCNLIPLAIVKYAESTIKDVQFKSSFKFVLSLFLFPVFYLLQFAVLTGFFVTLPVGLLFMAGFPVSGFFALIYQSAFRRYQPDMKYWFFRQRKPAQAQKLVSIKHAMEQIIEAAETSALSSR